VKRFVKNKKILVTGAGGFIGSHLVEKLVALGADVRCFVRYNSRNDRGMIEFLPKKTVKDLEVIAGDLRDGQAVRNAVHGCSIVFHLGALIAIPYSYYHPVEVVDTNVIGTLNVLNASREECVTRLIHTSTSEVYGTARYVPIDEKHPLQGQSPYSASKIGADKIAESFYCSFGLPVSIIRPFNTFGPRQSARAVIPAIISQALTGKKVFLGSIHPTRDYTYVTDTVEGFISVAGSEKSLGKVINIGSGKEIKIGELAKLIIGLIGKKNKLISDKNRIRPRDSEVERLLANNSKAKGLLDWEPRVPLEEGIKRTIEWIRANPKFFKPSIYNV